MAQIADFFTYESDITYHKEMQISVYNPYQEE